MPKVHDIVAHKIAKKFNTYYNIGHGPDIHKFPMVVEVVMAGEIEKGLQTIKRFEGPAYIAGATALAVDRAKIATRGSNIGVMDQFGRIVKRSTR